MPEDRIPIPSSLFDERKYSKIAPIVSDIPGGPSSVDLYLRVDDGTLCAIKHSKTPNRDPKLRAAFRREVQILSSNAHPSIVQLFHYGVRDETHEYPTWMELEFIPGGTVRNLIAASVKQTPGFPPLDETRTLVILYGVASALSFLHSNSVVHRDVRSANILLDQNLEPRLADFEFAHRVRYGEKVAPPRVLNYSAPELLDDARYTEKVDVYSFGILIYELRTREVPYADAKDRRAITNFIVGGRTKPVLAATDPYFQLYQACTSFIPSDRPSMKEVVIRLDELSRLIPGIELKKYLVQKFRIYPKRPPPILGDVGTVANLKRAAEFLPKAMYQAWELRYKHDLGEELSYATVREYLKKAAESEDQLAIVSYRELVVREEEEARRKEEEEEQNEEAAVNDESGLKEASAIAAPSPEQPRFATPTRGRGPF
jgi:serine/threonine protein kinase